MKRVNSSTSADRWCVWGLRYRDDLILRDDGTDRLYALHDYFSVTAVVDTSGNVQERYGYDAFGAPRYMDANFGSRSSSNYGWETLYAAYRYDLKSGLYQVRNRYLHPNLGRWVTRDPLGEIGFHSFVESFETQATKESQLYTYVRNNPPNNVDFFGLFTFDSVSCYFRSCPELGRISTHAYCQCICTLDTTSECKNFCMMCSDILKEVNRGRVTFNGMCICLCEIGNMELEEKGLPKVDCGRSCGAIDEGLSGPSQT